MSLDAGPDLAGAVGRLATYFTTLDTRQGVLARRVLGQPATGDAALTERLLAELTAELRPDGSVGGAAVPTIWRAHELIDLGRGGDHPDTGRVLQWILNLQGAPGAFGEGCTPERHAHRVCEHFLAGFFSPGPVTQRLAPVMLPNGKVFRVEAAARFVVSCLALRAVLRAGGEWSRPPLVGQHVASLARLSERWTEWTGYFAPDVMIAGLHALALAPDPHQGVIARLVGFVAGHQFVNGTWPNADLFHTIEALLAAGTGEARTAVRYALPALLERQRPDGSFGTVAQQERALIGLRALLWAG